MQALLVLFIVGLIFAGALGAGAAVFFLQRFMSPEPSPMQQRLMSLKSQHEEETAHFFEHTMDFSRIFKREGYDNVAIGRFLERYSFTNYVRKSLYQAGMDIPVDKFIIYFMVGPAVIGLVMALVNVVFIAIAATPLLAMLLLKFKRSQRLKKFTTQLPEALSLICSSLRAGHSFHSAIGVVGNEMKDPMGTEFLGLANDINLGIPVKDALNKMSDDLDLPDMRMFVTAVLIQREAGGNLAEVLDKLSYTIRERFKLKGQISALTGQARLTGYVLGLAPVGLFALLFLVFNSYVAPLYTTPLGHIMMIAAGIMQIIGFIVMKKIIDIRV